MSFDDDSSMARRDQQMARLAPAIEAFEAAWKEGGRPAVEEFLPDAGEPDRDELLRALLEIDREHRERLGEKPRPGEYLPRFSPADHPAILSEFEKTRDFDHLPPQSPAGGNGRRDDENGEGRQFPISLPGYRILRALGAGGMGTVYLAEDQRLKRQVVVKTILPELLHRPSSRFRFSIEAQAAAQVQSDHVVKVFDSGEATQGTTADGEPVKIPYLVMEYIRGRTLDKLLVSDAAASGKESQFAPLDDKTAARYMLEAARGLAAVHERGIIHRDIKPSNIFLDEASGRVLIGDFGLAKLDQQDDDLTATGAQLGTMLYMAPEQFEDSKSVSQRADVYSLGATLYFLLGGRPPFSGKSAIADLLDKRKTPASPRQVRRQTLSGAKSADRRAAPQLSADLEFICLKCLEKSPEERYASAAVVADRLERFLTSRPDPDRPVGLSAPLYHSSKWCRRHPLAAIFAATVAVLLAVLAIGGGVSYYQIAGFNEELGSTNARLENTNVQLKNTNVELNAALETSRRRLAEQFESRTYQGWNEQNYQQAAVWSAAALRLEQDDPQRAALHRRRTLNTLRQLSKPEQMLFHDEQPVFAEFDGSGEYVVTAAGRSVRVWNRETGKLVDEIPARQAIVTQARFHPTEQQVLVTAGDAAWLFSVGSDDPLAELRREGEAFAVAAFSSQGDRAVFITNDQQGASKALIWQLAGEGPPEARVTVCDPHDFITCIDLTGGGDQLVTACSGVAHVWTSERGEVSQSLEHPARIGSAAFSHDGRRLAVGGDDGLVKLWYFGSGREAWSRPIPVGGAVTFLAFSEDDTNLIAWSGLSSHVIDVSRGVQVDYEHFPLLAQAYRTAVSPRFESPDQEHYVELQNDRSVRIYNSAGFAPDALHLVSTKPFNFVEESPGGEFIVTQAAGDRLGETEVMIWNAATGERHMLTNAYVALGPDDKSLAILRYGVLSLAEMKSARSLRRVGEFPWGVGLRFAPDGKSLLLWGGDAVAQVALDDGRTLQEFSLEDESILSAELDADGKRLLTWSLPQATIDAFTNVPEERRNQFLFSGAVDLEGTTRLWDTASGQVVARLEDAQKQSARFSLDGKYAYAPCRGGFVRFWNAESGEIQAEVDHSNLQFAALSPENSRLVTLGSDGTMRLTDPIAGELLLSEDLPGLPAGAAFSPGGAEFVVAAANAAWVYDSATGRPLSPPLAHQSAINHVAFMQDGRRVLTDSHNENGAGIMRLWNVEDDDSWPAEDLAAAAEFVGGYTESNGHLIDLSPQAAVSTWNDLRRQRPEISIPTPSQRLVYHFQQFTGRNKTQDWHRAAGHLTHLLEAESSLSAEQRAYYLTQRADIYSRQGKLRESEADLTAALEINSSAPLALALLAHVRVLERRWQDAVEAATRAIEQDWPGFAARQYGAGSRWSSWPWELRGRAFAELEDWQAAASDFRAALRHISLPDKALMQPDAVAGELQDASALAVCLRQLGEDGEFQEIQNRYLDRFADTANADHADAVLRMLTLGGLDWLPASRQSVLFNLAQVCKNETRLYTAGQTHRAYIFFRLGLVRNTTVGGNLRTSIDTLGENATPREWLPLAMHLHARGETGEPQELLEKSREWIANARQSRQAGAGPDWKEMLAYELLLEEAAGSMTADVSLAKAEERVRDLEDALESDPRDNSARLELAIARAELGVLDAGRADWPLIAAELAALLEAQPDDVALWYYRALSLVAAGDDDAYASLCRDVANRFWQPETLRRPNVAKTTLLALSLAPNPAINLKIRGELPPAVNDALSGADPLRFLMAVWQGELALPERGRAGAIYTSISGTVEQSRDPFALLLRAVVARDIGALDAGEARSQAIEAAREAIASPSEKWYRKLELQLLLRKLEQ